MKVHCCLPLLLVFAGTVLATEPPSPSGPPLPPKEQHSPWVFSLLPKSLQTHPALNFHVITEMTADGRKVAAPTAGHPAYYLEQAGQFRQLGNNTPAGEQPPPVTDLARAMQKALAENSYLPASPSTPLPSVVVVFNYGSFARFSTTLYDMQESALMDELSQNADPNGGLSGIFLRTGDERDVDALLPMVLSNPQERTDILQRAELIGGGKFAREMSDALNREASYRQSQTSVGISPSSDLGSPFHQFMNANIDLMSLVDESFSSCYFVVASAFDYRAMRQGKKVLLWRTKMTVNALGISMSESLPSLVVSAGPYLGRDMTEAVTLTRRISREGKVEVGEPTVIGYSEGTIAPEPEKKR